MPKQFEQIVRMHNVILSMLAEITEFHGAETGGHIKRVTAYVSAILDALGQNPPAGYELTEEQLEYIKKSVPIHDLGKISVPDYLMQKAGALADEEFKLIQKHAKAGADLIKHYIDEYGEPSFLDTAYDINLTHHERWDGNGYPQGLSGERIPICGRIMAIADVFDALISKRPYRDAFHFDRAIQIMRAGRGTHFDPVLIDTFISIQDEIRVISETVKK